jgi:hypothetical protein
MQRLVCSVAALAALASASSAGVINVSPIGGGLTLNSGPAPAFGPGLNFASGSLAALNAQLNADGIITDGRITFAAVDTDTGLAMVALIDQAGLGGGADNVGVHMDSVSDVTSIALASDPIMVFPSGPNRIAFGEFAWDSLGDGDGFAWSNLSEGTSITWRFQKTGPLGLTEPATFQFVDWNGSNWELISVDPSEVTFSASGEFGFAANVLVVPAPAGAALLGLAGLAAFRRRR